MTIPGIASAALALTLSSDSSLLDAWFRPTRIEALERSLRADLDSLGDESDHDRERLAVRLLDLWMCLDPDPDAARALLATFDFGDNGLETRAPRLLAHRMRLEGRLAEAHDWERRARTESGLDEVAALLVAVESRAIATPEAERECRALLERVGDALPTHPTPAYLEVDVARTTSRCDSATVRLERFATLARLRGHHESADWAQGLAAEIEARDLRRPRAAASRCERWYLEAKGVPAQDRAAGFLDWYSRGAAEHARSVARRERLRRFAWGAAFALAFLLVGACLATPSRRR